jgi:hypothetical protein
MVLDKNRNFGAGLRHDTAKGHRSKAKLRGQRSQRVSFVTALGEFCSLASKTYSSLSRSLAATVTPVACLLRYHASLNSFLLH